MTKSTKHLLIVAAVVAVGYHFYQKKQSAANVTWLDKIKNLF